MPEKHHEVRKALLEHVQSLFEEMEEEMALSHQEKLTLLEDALHNASDTAELKVAFEQWFNEHVDDIGWDYEPHEVWNAAVGGTGLEMSGEKDSVLDDDDDLDKDESLEGFGLGDDEEKDSYKDDFKNSDEY